MSGRSNLIIGSGNKLNGDNSYVYASGFNGNADDDLIMQKFQIDLKKI
jgi:hypothetical protein